MRAKQIVQNAVSLVIAAVLFFPLILVGIPLLKLWLWVSRVFGGTVREQEQR